MSEIELKVFLESKIDALEKIIITRIDAGDKALAIQTREFERRLLDLNGEQARLAADRERYLPRELFDQSAKDMNNWRSLVEGFMATIRGQSKGLSLSWSIFSALIGALVSAITVWATLKGIK